MEQAQLILQVVNEVKWPLTVIICMLIVWWEVRKKKR